MRTQRIVSFLLAAFLIVSSVGAVFLVFKQSKEADKLDKVAQDNITEQTNKTEQTKECKVQGNPTSKNKPADILKLDMPANDLIITDSVAGDGEEAKLNDCITVNYRLNLADGTIVAGNDTFASGKSISFDLVEGGLIEGWIKGIPGMKVGGLRRLVVPASMGYGNNGTNSIPAGSTLVFDVELLDIKR